MGSSFLRVRRSLTALDSEPQNPDKLKAVLQGIVRFWGGQNLGRDGREGWLADARERNSPAGADIAPRQRQAVGGSGRAGRSTSPERGGGVYGRLRKGRFLVPPCANLCQFEGRLPMLRESGRLSAPW